MVSPAVPVPRAVVIRGRRASSFPTALHSDAGRTKASRPKRNALALITNDLLASFRKVTALPMPIWDLVAYSYSSCGPHLS